MKRIIPHNRFRFEAIKFRFPLHRADLKAVCTPGKEKPPWRCRKPKPEKRQEKAALRTPAFLLFPNRRNVLQTQDTASPARCRADRVFADGSGNTERQLLTHDPHCPLNAVYFGCVVKVRQARNFLGFDSQQTGKLCKADLLINHGVQQHDLCNNGQRQCHQQIARLRL